MSIMSILWSFWGHPENYYFLCYPRTIDLGNLCLFPFSKIPKFEDLLRK